MRSRLVWRDLDADFVSPVVKGFHRGEVHTACTQSPSWRLFLQFLLSPLVLEALPVFWIRAVWTHLLKAAILTCCWNFWQNVASSCVSLSHRRGVVSRVWDSVWRVILELADRARSFCFFFLQKWFCREHLVLQWLVFEQHLPRWKMWIPTSRRNAWL